MFVDETFWLAGRRCVVALLTGCRGKIAPAFGGHSCANGWKAHAIYNSRNELTPVIFVTNSTWQALKV